ncbi:type II RES/Xre toxin-antitoxin system antitoxin [Prosthecobacter vanneervenii]|uniref:Putative toxin-antitoxin system antitoxin component (TIGR02293 family) n=1 Tax=Prosthecobacter vanneervenii TaxID=48466 RepID=A0A7W7Y8A2_9BACT|nr:antitoxin Xre/MbcA/ParS toxin-binding domain-containing protein [Prosthecobacter vanneervenii]MBB5031468.1 putative toxin-antitoxin system antitoxin component (TIGR02293 family) [Prosthecobacter vanneervenii]
MKKQPIHSQGKAAASGRSIRQTRDDQGERGLRKNAGRYAVSEAPQHGPAVVSETQRPYSTAAPARVVSTKEAGNIVHCLVHAAPEKAVVEHTPAQLIRSLKLGLPVQELDDLRSSLDVSMERLVPMLGISKATLHRRMATGRLDLPESDRVVRFARLVGRAVSVMESLENARRWLTSPQVGLGGAVPLEYAETEVGAREVENLLGRIEYGVYA